MNELIERLGDTEFANDVAVFMSGKDREGVWSSSDFSALLG